jgi:hypothetical protein
MPTRVSHNLKRDRRAAYVAKTASALYMPVNRNMMAALAMTSSKLVDVLSQKYLLALSTMSTLTYYRSNIDKLTLPIMIWGSITGMMLGTFLEPNRRFGLSAGSRY